MKRIIYYLFFLISPFTSCVMDDLSIKSTLMWDDDFDLAPRIPSEATELEVPFIFGTSADWNVVISDPLTKSHSWCSTPQDNGTRSYEITLHLIFEPNDTAEDRVVNVTVKTLFDSVLLVVTQSGSDDALTPEGQSITYNDSFALFQSVFADSKVLTPEFVFNATEAWSVECESEGDWISVSNASGEKGDLITLGVNFEENINEDEEGREGTITISTSKDEVMLTIKQHAKGVSIIPPLDFALAQTVEGSATSLDPPFVFSVQEAWTVLVTTDVDGDIDAKDTGAGDEQWLSVDQMEGEAGYNIPLAITFDVNATDQREGRVTITTEGGSSVELTIIQLGDKLGKDVFTYNDGFEFEPIVPFIAGVLDPVFEFSSTETWVATVTTTDDLADISWVTVPKNGVANTNITFPISFDENEILFDRTATITIETIPASGNEIVFNITQERKPYPDYALVLTASGQLENDFNNQSLSTSITSLTIVDAALNEKDWAFLKNIPNLNYLDIEGTITTAIYGYYEENGYYSYILNIETILLPSTLITIGEFAFQGCTGLTSIDLPDGVTTIEWYAFYGCTGLTSIDLPSSLTEIGYYAFYDCTGLTSVTLPDGLTVIGDAAFYQCTALTSIDLPDGLTRIGERAFYDCTGLTSVTLPDGLTTIIGEDAFHGCTALTSITIPAGVTTIEWNAFQGCTALTSITILEGVTTIGGFNDCTALTSIDLPSSLTTIEWNAFYGCTTLTSITIPEGVTEIGGYAFLNCTALTSIDLPDGLTEIADGVFQGCTALTSITIPEGVTTIGNFAFADCTGLTSITIPEGVTTIVMTAFSGCTALTSIDLPDGLTRIESYVFSDCTGLTSITIPAGVTEIGYEAFNNCTGLTFITVEATIPPTLDGTSFTNTNNCPIYVPTGTVDDYKTADIWDKYADRIFDIATKP